MIYRLGGEHRIRISRKSCDKASLSKTASVIITEFGFIALVIIKLICNKFCITETVLVVKLTLTTLNCDF